jgi:hypothetical protein
MMKLSAALALSAALIVPTHDGAQLNSGYLQMLADTGCDSKYSEQKRADLFNQFYYKRPSSVIAEVVKISKGDLLLKVLPTTTTWIPPEELAVLPYYDLSVTMRHPRSVNRLQVAQRV